MNLELHWYDNDNDQTLNDVSKDEEKKIVMIRKSTLFALENFRNFG